MTTGCTGRLVLDGQSECLLNMKVFLVSYEVLRRFMFEFLLGRQAPFSIHDFHLHICTCVYVLQDNHVHRVQCAVESP